MTTRRDQDHTPKPEAQSSTRDHLHPWLDRECLEIKKIINIARGADIRDWDLPEKWEIRFKMLKDAIEGGKLPAIPVPFGRVRFYTVCLLEIWLFLVNYGVGEKWDWLRKFCRDWEPQCGLNLPDQETVDPREPARPQGSFAEADVREWYKRRAAQWKLGDFVPTEKDDLGDVRAKFKDQIPRDFIRSLRHKFGRDEWNVNRRGPKSPPPSQ